MKTRRTRGCAAAAEASPTLRRVVTAHFWRDRCRVRPAEIRPAAAMRAHAYRHTVPRGH